MIPQEKAEEYKQVAALVCLDLDVLAGLAKEGVLSKERWEKQILRAHAQKETILTDATARQRLYTSAALVFHLAAQASAPSA